MNGPEHYTAAEADLETASEYFDSQRYQQTRAEFLLARAQVHATLAATAIAAEPIAARYTGNSTDLDRAWAQAL